MLVLLPRGGVRGAGAAGGRGGAQVRLGVTLYGLQRLGNRRFVWCWGCPGGLQEGEVELRWAVWPGLLQHMHACRFLGCTAAAPAFAAALLSGPGQAADPVPHPAADPQQRPPLPPLTAKQLTLFAIHQPIHNNSWPSLR